MKISIYLANECTKQNLCIIIAIEYTMLRKKYNLGSESNITYLQVNQMGRVESKFWFVSSNATLFVYFVFDICKSDPPYCITDSHIFLHASSIFSIFIELSEIFYSCTVTLPTDCSKVCRFLDVQATSKQRLQAKCASKRVKQRPLMELDALCFTIRVTYL